MRADFTLAMRRESKELEQELVDRRIDEAFEQVYDFLEPAATYLRGVCDGEGRRALEQLERAYFRALQISARSGIGCRPSRKADAIPPRRAVLPAAPRPEAGDRAVAEETTSPGGDTVLFVTPCR